MTENNSSQNDSHWHVGKNYMIRTVTHINIGTLTKVTPTELVLVDVAWIADTGRYADFVGKGETFEVEPYPDGLPVIMNRQAICDACQWVHPLPREQK